MKRMAILFLLPVASLLFAAEAPQKAGMQTKAGLYVDAREAYAMLNAAQAGDVVLIDVRDAVEIRFTGYTEMTDVHVPWKIIDASTWNDKKRTYGGRLNADFANHVKLRLDRLGVGKGAALIFMCRSGSTRSAPAADALYDLGYAKVYSMVDGFEGVKAGDGPSAGARVVNGWKNSGLPWGWKLEKAVMYGIEQ